MSTDSNASRLTLPDRPNLEQLRKQARDLQQANPGMKLSEAQRDLARGYGFASWPKLVRHVTGVAGRDAFVDAALGGRLDEADVLLQEDPELGHDPVVIAMRGDAAKAEAIDPIATYPPKGWTALHYLCFSRYHGRVDRVDGLRNTAASLLDRGADPNAYHIDPRYPEPPSTSMYGVCGLNDDPEIVRMLLAHGANPQDGEVLYHGTELKSLDGLRLVLEAGGNTKGTNGVAHMLDRDHLEGLALILAYYGEPDDDLGSAIHHALLRRRSVEHIRMLVEYGADPHYRREGVNPYVRARLLQLPPQADYLASIGAGEVATDAEAFAIACVEGSSSVKAFSDELSWVVVYAAANGQTEALGRLLDAGFDPDGVDGWGKTGLHEAGWLGRSESVKILLEHGASLAVVDKHHNGTPLNFTVAGAAWGANPGGNHLECARLMLEAGAAAHCSAKWVIDLTKDMPEMRKLLSDFGVTG